MSLDADLHAGHTVHMIQIGGSPIHLTHIDPDQNMARFYDISAHPTLFGETTIFRNWGRIGTRGQSMMVTYSGANEAAAAVRKLERQKQRRGYRADEIPPASVVPAARAIIEEMAAPPASDPEPAGQFENMSNDARPQGNMGRTKSLSHAIEQAIVSK
jgi:predicted DNA-binding WGR domain protein